MKKMKPLAILLFAFLASCATLSKQEEGSPPLHLADRTMTAEPDGCGYITFLKGKAAELAGDPEAAADYFRQALECDQEADYIRTHLAMIYSQTGRGEEAVGLMEAVVARNPADLNASMVLAGLYAHLGDFNQAVAVYRKLLKQQPENQNALLMLGALYARNSMYDEASQVFGQLVKNDPQFSVGYFYLARVYREMGEKEKAAVAYEKALELNWSAVLAGELADFHEQNRAYQKAAAVYLRILDDDAANEAARRKLVGLYLQMKKTDAALAELRRLRQYSADPKPVDLAIGQVLLQNKRHTEAINHFKQLLKREPDFDAARYLLAVAYHEAGDNRQSKKMLETMPPTSKRYEEAVLFWARLLRDEKDFPALEKLLTDNLAEARSRRVSFYVALAAVYEEQGKLEKGREVYLAAIREYPENTKLLFEYGLFLDKAGEQEAAMATMEKLLTINPDDAYALNYVGYTWADSNRNLDQALKYIEKAIAQEPEDGYIRDSLGWVYYRLGRLEEALVELEKSASLRPEDPTIHEHLGEVYERLGRVSEAVGRYEKALELHKDEKKKELVRRKIEALRRGEPR